MSWTEQIFTASDGYRVRYRHYPTERAAKARIVYLHGIQSHAGWYPYSCERFAAAGYEVRFLDRRGSGRNDVARGDAPSFRRLLDDLAEFLRSFAAGDRLPVVLVGVSWGGKLAVALQRRHPGLVDGLALLCPGFCPKVRPPLRQRVRIALARLFAPARRFPIPLNDPDLFTATPRWLEFLKRDPLALHTATARLLVESFRLDLYVRRAVRFVKAPVLLLLAGQDRIIDNARTRSLIARCPGPVETIEYPDAQHTLEFEPNPDRFLTDLLAWIARSLPATRQPAPRSPAQ